MKADFPTSGIRIRYVAKQGASWGKHAAFLQKYANKALFFGGKQNSDFSFGGFRIAFD